MPTKRCHVCNRQVDYIRRDWHYISRLPSAVCSAQCILDWIEKAWSPAGYLNQATKADFMGQPTEVYSYLLQRFFRSRFEMRFAEWLIRHGLSFEYERYAFPVKDTSIWVPDFHLPGCRCFLEVKGSWGPGSHSKFAYFAKAYLEVELLLVPWTLQDDFGV